MAIPNSASQQCRIAIVGAGISGLSAAYTLKKAGLSADVYEATDHVGGRCRNDWEDGYKFFVGAGSTEPQWETTFSYLHELGIEDQVEQQAGEASMGFVTNGKPHLMRLGGPVPQMLGQLINFLPAFPAGTYAQGIKFLALMGKYIKALDFEKGDFTALDELSDISIYDWCQQNGYPDLCTYVLDPLVSNMVCDNSHHISMGHVIMLFSLMTGMCTLKDGMGVISEKLYEQVADQVKLRTPVEEVVIEGSKVRGVRVAGKLVEYDEVIVALDAITTRKLVPGLSDAQRTALENCNYSKVFYYQFGLKEANPTLGHGAVFYAANEGGYLAGLSQSDDGTGHPMLMSQTRAEKFEELAAMDSDERLKLIIAETRKVLPDFPENPPKVHVYRWNISVNLEGPGQFKAVNDLKANHLNDIEGLRLAGDYQFLIASTEGSMDAGRRRAEEIIAAQGLPVPQLQRPKAPDPKREGSSGMKVAAGFAAGAVAGAAITAFAKRRR